MCEIWKTVEGFDRYEVSNLGRVRHKGHKPLKPVKATKGKYLQVTFIKNGKKTNPKVHHLVAAAFIGKKPKGYRWHIDHIDNDIANCAATNLEIVTNEENVRRAWAAGRYDHTLGEGNHSTKLKAHHVRKIRDLCLRGIKQNQVAQRYKISPATIQDILKGRTWKWLDAA